MLVSIVVPCRNEARAINSFLRSVLEQELNDIRREIIIADGMSEDGTREVLKEFVKKHPEVQVIDNPRRIVSTGLNMAIKLAHGDIIIRLDVHTEYRSDYVRSCVKALMDTGADNVGGACLAMGEGYLGRAIASAFHSAFAVGGARWHQPTYEGPADTVHLGCWRRDVLARIGLFDENLVRSQDDELNLRLIRAGGTVWQSPKIVSCYRPRSSLSALFLQYFQYGFWKVAVTRKHHLPASWRHLIPAAAVLANCLFLAYVILRGTTGIRPIPSLATSWASLCVTYILTSLISALLIARKSGWVLFPILPVVFATYHLAHGSGFLTGLLYFSTKPADLARRETLFTELTR